MLTLESVKFTYRQQPVLNGVSFSLARESCTALLGASGAGKTTLFRLICGLLSPKSGLLQVDPSSIGYMTQDDLLFPWLTVEKNLKLALNLNQQEYNVDEVFKLLSLLGLEGIEKEFPEKLSKGMRQRVSLARVLLSKKKLLLLDEPFSSLDMKRKEELYQLINLWQKERKLTVFLITHDFYDAFALAKKALVLNQGKVVKQLLLKDHKDKDIIKKYI